MTAKHTPGPWKAINRQYQSRLGLSDDWRVLDSHGDDLLELFGSDGMDEPTALPAEANAHLIAAAPELLEACKLIDAAPYGVALGDLEKLRAAIAKAEGRS